MIAEHPAMIKAVNVDEVCKLGAELIRQAKWARHKKGQSRVQNDTGREADEKTGKESGCSNQA